MSTRRLGCVVLALLTACAVGGCDVGVGPRPASGGVATAIWHVSNVAAIGPMGVDDSTVFVFDTSRVLHAYARRNGAPRWQVALPNIGTNWGSDVTSGTVVVAVDRLVAVDPLSGAERWRLSTPEGVGTLAMSTNDSLIFPTSYRGTGIAIAVDVRSGTERWRMSVLPTDSVASVRDQVRVVEPVVSGGFVASAFAWWKGSAQPKGGVAVLDARTGVRQWSVILPAVNGQVSTFPSRAAIGNGAVAVSTMEGFVYVLEQASGALRWTGAKVQLVGADSVVPSPSDIRPVAIADAFVVVGSARGYVTVHELQSGIRRWHNNSELGAVMEIHRVGQARVLTRHIGGGLTLFELATGAIVWRLSPRSEAERLYSVKVAGDTVLATSIVGGVSVFRLP